MTTKQDIREWLEQGAMQGATHLLVVCDTFDHEDYPVFVMSSEVLSEKAKGYDGVNMQIIMECYDLSLDWDFQLNESRSYHGWRPSQPRLH